MLVFNTIGSLLHKEKSKFVELIYLFSPEPLYLITKNLSGIPFTFLLLELDTIIIIPTELLMFNFFPIELIQLFDIYICEFNIFLLCKCLSSKLKKFISYPFFDIFLIFLTK